ncbi:enhancer of polycomb-like-domain-containing protein [Zychaea mexicana]|uniref:enhancer of polycomb-like-domain-containing protein n=1 Tax=Zychaea mexicana TaxID=64656 RepID=UPI0022FE0226|nr:enhancer of polycomb-like-domain-containing protein [Zychaea mexicana]KAI9490712.1 enhancer of polycomb-like-domain-containing protein [Zychaea mexicana]
MVSRFRVKKLSPKHPLPIFKESQLPDITDAANVQRSVPQIETGVEKEEEEEHDLQAAISAAHAAVTTGAKVESYIPTPDASHNISEKEYRKMYKKAFNKPSTLIRFSSTVEDTTGCPYVMDEEDDAFLKQYNNDTATTPSLSEDDFEKIMWQYESTVDQHWPHLDVDPSQIPSLNALQHLLPDKSKLNERVYQHWRERRLARQGKDVIPQLLSEDTLKGEIDPYVCFRRRETKPIRKTRRTDQQSLERLRKLRSEMEMSRNLLEMVLRREKIRKEGLVLEHTVFDKKCKLREYQRQLGIKEDEDLLPLLSKKKRKTSMESGSSGATIKIPLNKLKRDDGRHDKSPMQMAIDAELARKRELDAPYEDVTECPYQPFPLPLPKQFYQSLSQQKQPHQPCFRKRIGRGGRVLIDRTGHKRDALGGKTAPATPFQQKAYERYRFDSDSSDEDEPFEVDEMDDRYLQHRTHLLSEAELRNLVTIPFVTPQNVMQQQHQQAQARANGGGSGNNHSRSGSLNGSSLNGQNKGIASLPIKRQNSRTKMTPQQAAVAMANGMIAANMAAVVNGNQKNAMQMAMAAAQQQQQQQQHPQPQQQQQQQGNASPLKQSVSASPHPS